MGEDDLDSWPLQWLNKQQMPFSEGPQPGLEKIQPPYSIIFEKLFQEPFSLYKSGDVFLCDAYLLHPV